MDDSVRKVYRYCLEGNKRQYIIPVYQRNYDWEIENCKKFLDDIIVAYEKEKSHFIGMIIQVQKNEDINGLRPFIIVDGQQRLTTIYLLLKALFDLTDREGTREDIYDGLFNKFRDEDVTIDKINKIKLKANTFDNHQLMLLMENDFDNIDKKSNICINYDYFKRRISELTLSGVYEHRDIMRGIEQLTAAIINLDDTDDPQAIFERINFYGEDLKLDDLIRNFVLMTELNQERLFELYWRFIESNIEKNKRPQFFIDFLNSYSTGNITSKNAYEGFKAWANKQTNIETALNKLKKSAKYYSAFIGNKSHYPKKINEKLAAFIKINQSTVYTFLFKVFDDYENNIINIETLESVLSLLINYSIRRIICEIPSNSLRGLYKTLYNRIFNDVKDKGESYYDACVCMFVENLKGTRDVFPDDSFFIQSFQTTKIYSRDKRFAKYILGLLENTNSKEVINVDSSNITIEHIMPQNSNNPIWRDHIGDRYDKVYNEYLDTFGNITLTGYNSSLSDNSFEKKQEILKKSSIKITYLNKEFIENERWGEYEITQRAQRLSVAIVKLFPFPIWSGINYHPITQKDLLAITLQDTMDVKGLKPMYYEFIGERNEISSYREVLSGIINTLYVLVPEKIHELSRTNFKLKYAQRVYISYNKDKLRRATKIEGAEIFYEINLSGINILSFIKEIMENCEIDESEFVLYCKRE